ncbi:MAG: PD40 domain-containing protein [Clostridiales bacterium]|nr:PD40 domain-containing protein [Clostridiales bacterium]
MKRCLNILTIILLLVLLIMVGCETVDESTSIQQAPISTRTKIVRDETLPKDIIKRSSETDISPPILHSDEFENPIAMPYPLNTSGGEDSPFILPDGKTMYFFFTPDVRIPPQEQVMDGTTGIWVTHKSGDTWSTPQRVWLQDVGKLALDGAAFVRDNEIWFASAREGYTGLNIFKAIYMNNTWSAWSYIGDQLMKEYRVGELHIYKNELYYHSDLHGGKGEFDIWVTKQVDGKWSEPENLENINTETLDGFPYISSDGLELWFTRIYKGTPAIYRSYRVDGIWQEAELIVSQFAGEPTLDDEGNLYFTHHFYENGEMIEADIYVAYKKK